LNFGNFYLFQGMFSFILVARRIQASKFQTLIAKLFFGVLEFKVMRSRVFFPFRNL
jgi:hypothetical protein